MNSFFSAFFDKLFVLKSLPSTKTRKLLVQTMEGKFQIFILRVRKKPAPLLPCILVNVQFSPKIRKLHGTFILLESTALQNLTLQSSGTFITKKFWAFLLHHNIKNLTMALSFNQRKLILTISSTKLTTRTLMWRCVHVNITFWILNLKGQHSKFSVLQMKSATQKKDDKRVHFFRQKILSPKNCQDNIQSSKHSW